jgi:hypothetical protein
MEDLKKRYDSIEARYTEASEKLQTCSLHKVGYWLREKQCAGAEMQKIAQAITRKESQ